MKSYIQVYTGNGKGKTTAALGLALRAIGAGKKVFIGQFAKGQNYSELVSLKRLADSITIKQYGQPNFIIRKATTEDIKIAKEGLKDLEKIISSNQYDVVILDEANIAVHFNLFSVDELLKIIDLKPNNTELVITGRNADPKIIDKADLVTEMVEIKHYYKNGVNARKGIEN